MTPSSSSGLLFEANAPATNAAFVAMSYVPLLLDRRGERRALSDLRTETWDRVTPLMQITPPALRDGPEQGTSPELWIAALAQAVGNRVIYLDPAGVQRRDRAAKPLGASTVARLLTGASDAGMRYVPVYPVGQPALVDLTARAAAEHGLGLAVRHRVDGLTSMGGRSLADVLARELEALKTSPSVADLIVDLAYLHRDFTVDADDVARLLDPLLAVGSWRSVVIAASSVPPTLADEVGEGQFGGILRREWALWRALRFRYPALRFGDYGIQNPIPPDPINTQHMRASIRYTSGDWMYVVRGEGPIRQMRADEQVAQYRHLAQLLFLHDAFIECCAGDRAIEDCADGRSAVRAQQAWRAVSTLHHLSTVAVEVTALAPRPAATADAEPVSRRARSASGRGKRGRGVTTPAETRT